MNTPTVGIDVSKAHLDVAIQGLCAKSLHRQFPYTSKGQKRLLAWLDEHDLRGKRVCLEATGRYSIEIAETLHRAGYIVSIENPARTKHFARSLMLRQKTDKVDATVLAHYASVMTPRPWSPPTILQSNLQELKRLAEDLQTDRTRILNRLEGLRAASPARPYLEEQLQQIERQITQIEKDLSDYLNQDSTLHAQSQLLMSIKGIGKTTAIELLAEIPDWSLFGSADELVAFAGLCPQHHQSGNKAGYSRLSKQGNAHIRKTLYYPALSALQHNPHLKRFAERLKASGKPKMVVVVAVMRKLLVLAYAILKSGQPYDPSYQVSS
jgi:transposase